MKTHYQGVRIAPETQGVKHMTSNLHIHYPGVRPKGSNRKVVRKVSSDGKVYEVLSYNAFVSQEQLKKENQSKISFK